MTEVEPRELQDCQDPSKRSSRRSASDAGWSASKDAYVPGNELGPPKWTWVEDEDEYGGWYPWLDGVQGRRWRDFSWLTASALLDSINDRVAKVIHDLVNPRRQRWIAGQRAAGTDESDFIVSHASQSFFILGDPGEADGSQYSVVQPMLSIDDERPTDFMLILSDVIYPAGDINDYINGFYEPYKDYLKPVYAVPGNHDWYDGLQGFMFHFCGAEPLPQLNFLSTSYTGSERIARFLWRQASRPKRTELLRRRARRMPDDTRWTPPQPAPYFALDMGSVLLVSIDTGIKGTLDREQGEWLSRVSQAPPHKPKLLLTGKPIWVDGDYHPCPIAWDDEKGTLGPHQYETVDDVVRDPQNRYIAAIGGDVHNYQRYTVTIDDPRGPEAGLEQTRAIEYIVAGGSGAYMSATHRIDHVNHTDREGPDAQAERLERIREGADRTKLDYAPPHSVAEPIGEEQFRCYPVRGDSLVYFARFFGRRMLWATASLVLAGLLALGGLFLWWWLGHSGYLPAGVWSVALASFATLVSMLVAVGLARGISWVAPPHLRAAGALLGVPAVVAVITVFALSRWPAWETWIWKAVVVTLAVVIVPLAVIIVTYYLWGTSESMLRRRLLLAASIVGLVALLLPHAVFKNELGAIAGAIGITVALAIVISLVRQREDYDAARYAVGKKPTTYIPLTLAIHVGVLAYLAWQLWDFLAPTVPLVVVAVAVVVIVLTALWLASLVPDGGVRALRAFFSLRDGMTPRLDPDQALRYVHERYPDAEETDAVRWSANPPDWRTVAIGDYLMDNPTRLIKSGVSEIGNADLPPMFKSFLHLQVRDRDIVITCYGVTGWGEHDGETPARSVPIEDCVEIPLYQ